MRETFTLMIALMLSVAVNAQTKIHKLDVSMGNVEKNPELSILTPSAKKDNAPKRKIKVDSGERIMGFYDTDDLPNYSGGYLTTGFYGSHPVANDYEENVLSRFVGGQIVRMRFAVAIDVYVSSAFIYSVDERGYVSGEPIASVEINQTISPGWYDVELEEPVTIEEGSEFLIGYELTEVSGTYPLITDFELDVDYTSEYGFFIYMTYNGQTGWFYLGDSYGSLCVQAVVKGNFPDDDITLKNLSTKKYASQGTDLDYSFKIRSCGNNIPESYELKVAIDGEEVETLSTPIALTNNYQTLSKTLDTSNIAQGSHTLKVSVASINGNTPTEYTDDDVLETSFVLYGGETMERQMHIIEQFTSIGCTNCPYGHDMLECLQEQQPGKYAWIAIHYNYNYEDPFYIDSSVNNIFNFAGATGYPSAAFSRALLTSDWLDVKDEMAIGIGYYPQYQELAAQCVNTAVDEAYEDIPAFVSVDIMPVYDSDTRELTITVSGEGISNAKQILDGNRLTIYLTEDGLISRQLNNGRWDNNYEHNNVLRAIPNTYSWGDDINWTSDSSYSNTVKTTLDSDWDDSQIYITAFVSGPMAVLRNGTWYFGDQAEGLVNNANRVKATDVPAGISAVAVNPEGVTKTYYTSDGRQLSAPMKGVNIVKSSDGTVKKLYVK